jgi:ribokinase
MDGHGRTAAVVVAGDCARAPEPPRPWASDLTLLLVSQELPPDIAAAWAQAARAAGVPVLLCGAPAAADAPALLPLADLLVLCEAELASLAHGDLDAAVKLGARGIVLTRGDRGVVAWRDGSRHEVPGHDVWAVDTTGAGDAFVGALAASLWQRRPFAQALARANFAASLACRQRGARGGMPRAEELEAAMRDWRLEEDRR